MKSHFKFPRRVRIHGGECGAVARALHHEAQKDALMSYEHTLVSAEKQFLRQADLGKAPRSTIERKQMSTKTTLKRIALVAVSALGFGLLSVAPSSAVALGAAGSFTQGTASPARANATFYQPLTYTAATAVTLATNDTLFMGATLLAKPTGSAVTSASGAFNNVASNATFAGSGVGITNTGTYTVLAARNGESEFDAEFSFVPDIAGTYQFLLYAPAVLAAAYTAGDPSTVVTVTVALGAPATATITSLGGSSVANANPGALVSITLKDAAGNTTVPSAFETVTLSAIASEAATAVTLSKSVLSQADFKSGAAVIGARIAGATADNVVTLTARLSGATTASLGSASITYVFPTATATTADIEQAGTHTTAGAINYKSGYSIVTAGGGNDTTAVDPSLTSHTWSFNLGATVSAASYYGVTVTDTAGGITGIANATWTIPITVSGSTTTAAKGANFSIAGSWLSGDSYTLVPVGPTGALDGLVVTATTDRDYTATVSLPATAVTSATGGSTTFTATVTNYYGLAQPNVIVTITQAGRNAKLAPTNIVTNASGQVSYTETDASTSTTNFVGTIKFEPTGGVDGADANGTTNASATGTINYVSSLTIGTVTVTGGSTADTAAFPAVGSSTYLINTGTSGAAGSTVTFTATVKDANGILIAGVPVTWTVDKATAGITKSATADASTCYTGSLGTCTTTVYAWEAPSKVTVTATAGGKSGTGYANFVNAATDARVVSATAASNVVTAKVVDRYGNPVAAVNLTASTTAGYFGTGASTSLGSTGADGTVKFILLGANSATVTVTGSAATYAQLDDAAGKIGATAVTAAVAGTSTGVGSSLAPAGVESASVAVTVTPDTAAVDAANAATDAAAEAIDAANAATDAANLAAEAADAATVAAEEARDAADAATAAVEELATQVATLMAALKAQITTLANTVAKIAKKVKA